MIQDTVRTRYVIFVYPTHGQDTRTTYLYKKKKSKSPQEDIYKNISFRDFFKYPSELVIATWMPSANHPPAASDPRMTTLTLPGHRNHVHVCHLQAAAASRHSSLICDTASDLSGFYDNDSAVRGYAPFVDNK